MSSGTITTKYWVTETGALVDKMTARALITQKLRQMKKLEGHTVNVHGQRMTIDHVETGDGLPLLYPTVEITGTYKG